MSAGWAVRMRLADLSAALRLRLLPGVEAAIVEPLTSHHVGALWLRGRSGDETLQQHVARLPADARYTLGGDGQLTPLGARVPTDRLPPLTWKPLADLAALAPQRARLPGQAREGVALRLVPSTDEREPAALLASSEDWHRYASTAPEVRLDRLAFAASSDGRILIWGRPTPPIPGVRLTESDGIFAPCGCVFSPAVDARMVRRVLRLPPEDLALFSAAGDWDRISREAFVRATRAAARVTYEQPPADDDLALGSSDLSDGRSF